MGLLSIIRKQKLKDQELRVLVLGLDNAGKTTIIKHILNEDVKTISPTMGFQINSILYKNYHLNVWDIGGQTSLRVFWGNYFETTNIIIWVIDALATERITESFTELRDKVLLKDRLGNGIRLLVLVNKIDLVEDTLKLSLQVTRFLENEMGQKRGKTWQVLMVSGHSGAGIQEALDWCIT